MWIFLAKRVTAAGIPLVVLAAALLTGCSSLRSTDTTAPPSDGIEVQWGVVTNVPDDGSGFVSELILRNRGDRVLPDEGWSLFFNFMRPIDTASVTPLVEIDHLNGDFYRLRPTDRFPAIGPGSRVRVTFASGAWAVSRSDAPTGFYFVWGDEEAGTIDAVGDAAVLPFETAAQTMRGRADELPVETAELRYAANSSLHELPDASVPRVLPRPQSMRLFPGRFVVDRRTQIGITSEDLRTEAEYLAGELETLLGTRPSIVAADGPAPTPGPNTPGQITLDVSGSLEAEGYRLSVTTAGIRIGGGSRAGVFYGIQSLRSILPQPAESDGEVRYGVQAVNIEDAPRFPYRGMHLDVARNFQSVETVKRLLDWMATYKLNRFHFHLSDDEGWRVAIEELPELTEVGGRRGHTLDEGSHLAPSLGSGPYVDRSPGSGFYSRDQFTEILRHARSRHIEVIPEIDLPGHARAAIVAMEARTRRTGDDTYLLSDPLDASTYESVQMYDDNVVNVCLPSTYRFIETVVDDLAEMYEAAGVALQTVHTGGDEVPQGVWQNSPACDDLVRSSTEVDEIGDLHDYFLRRFDAILDRHGATTAGWEEIALTERGGAKVPNPAFVDADFQPYVWNAVWGWGSEDTAYRLANAGYDVVLANANSLYFDLAHSKHPEEPGLYWAGYVDEKAPFAFIPFDLYKSAERDLFGRPIEEGTYADADRLTLAGRENILGLQAQLWGETITSEDRLDFMVFPRLISLAERAWAQRPDWSLIEDDERRREELDEDWNRIANAVGRWELPRLDRLDVKYRVPPPGAVIENGTLKANVSFPGLIVRYTTDGTEPTEASPVYTEPVAVQDTVKLRTFTLNGRGSRVVTVHP